MKPDWYIHIFIAIALGIILCDAMIKAYWNSTAEAWMWTSTVAAVFLLNACTGQEE